jgi:hypothetical protein
MVSNYITDKGSKNVVCAREGGANTTPLFLAAHFAKQNTKFGGGESEGGAGIHFPPTPFSARPARAVWFLPRRRRGIILDFVQKRFELRSVIATSSDFLKIQRRFVARSPRLRRVSLRKKPCISELNRKVGQIQIRLFGKANGGSELRSNSQMEFVSNFFRFCQRQKYKASFSIPCFCATGAMAKGDIIN